MQEDDGGEPHLPQTARVCQGHHAELNLLWAGLYGPLHQEDGDCPADQLDEQDNAWSVDTEEGVDLTHEEAVNKGVFGCLQRLVKDGETLIRFVGLSQ